MKSIVNRIVALVVIGILTGMLAFGKTNEKEVTFTNSITVNGTLVKKGTYKIAFNGETGELTIRKGKKVVATAQARVEKSNERYSFYTHSASSDPSNVPALVSVLLKDGELATILSSGDKRITSRQ